MMHSPGIRNRSFHIGGELLSPIHGVLPARISKGRMHLDARPGASGWTFSAIIFAIFPSVFCVLQAGGRSTVQAVVISTV